MSSLEKMKDNWAQAAQLHGPRATWAGQISTAARAEWHKLEFWAQNLNIANVIDLYGDHGKTSLPTLSLAWLNQQLFGILLKIF